MSGRTFLAAVESSPAVKGAVGTLAALTLSEWSSVASIAAAAATAVYMICKTLRLRDRPAVPARCNCAE